MNIDPVNTERDTLQACAYLARKARELYPSPEDKTLASVGFDGPEDVVLAVRRMQNAMGIKELHTPTPLTELRLNPGPKPGQWGKNRMSRKQIAEHYGVSIWRVDYFRSHLGMPQADSPEDLKAWFAESGHHL